MTSCLMVREIMVKKPLSKRNPPCPVRDDGEDPASDDDAVEEVGGKLTPGKYSRGEYCDKNINTKKLHKCHDIMVKIL